MSGELNIVGEASIVSLSGADTALAKLEEYQLPVLGACFMCNLASGSLLNSGAFEVTSLSRRGQCPKPDADDLSQVTWVAGSALDKATEVLAELKAMRSEC